MTNDADDAGVRRLERFVLALVSGGRRGTYAAIVDEAQDLMALVDSVRATRRTSPRTADAAGSARPAAAHRDWTDEELQAAEAEIARRRVDYLLSPRTECTAPRLHPAFAYKEPV